MAGTRKSTARVGLTREQVAKTALQCFNRYGVHRTSMNDIASTAGVSRQSVYRLFESRPLLLEYIATDRVNVLTDKLSKFLTQFDRLSDGLVEGLAYSVKLGRADELLVEILRQAGDEHFKIFMFGGTEEVQTAMLTAWGPLIQKSRETGEIDPSISDKEVIEWICNIGAVLNLREDYQEEDGLRILKQFVLPSLIVNRQAG